MRVVMGGLQLPVDADTGGPAVDDRNICSGPRP